MPLKNSKPGGSAFPKHRQNTSVFPPHWVDFYQLPVENDILAGAEWIYCLWVVLHHTNPPSYRASSKLNSTAKGLCTLLMQSRSWDVCGTFEFIKSHVRTKTLHTTSSNTKDALKVSALGSSTIFSRRSRPAIRTVWLSVSIFVADAKLPRQRWRTGCGRCKMCLLNSTKSVNSCSFNHAIPIFIH
ncbi:hypothetical protein DFS33DRAFT_1085129 [Desarmillaria ectypa]|nr:hypothetical protein DFS33DRAFT_1085129 [Desarmillaria ectypa]